MMVSLVKYTAVIGCATYITRKLLNRKQILLCKAKVALALLFVAEVLVTCLLRQHVSSISIFSMVGLSVGLHWILDRDNLGGIVTATILGYGISYLCFLVGLICIGTLYRMGVQALGDFTPFNAIIIGIIQMGMGFLLFRIKRLSHGLPFLADSQYGDIGVYLSVSILLVVSLGGSMAKSYIIIQFICYTLIICGTSLWFWWKRRMEREYKDQIRKREQARLQAAVTALQDQVAALRAENETFSRIIHRDNKLIPAMELAGHCWRMDSPVRALTVTAIYLIPADEAGSQLDLLSGEADRRRERLEKLEGAMDSIRSKYGSGAIAPASAPRAPGQERHAPPPGGGGAYLEEE